MYNLSKNIANIRAEKKFTQKSLANALNVSKGAITSYETGTRVPPIDKLEEMARLFNIKISDFFLEDTSAISSTKSNTKSKTPIIPKIPIGIEFKNSDVLDWIEIPSSLCEGADYATFVKGDNMEPKLLDNDLILVHQTNTLDNGNIGLFKIGEEIFCRKFFSNPITKEIVLKSLNKKYDPIYIEKNNKNNFSILGKVICKIDYNF